MSVIEAPVILTGRDGSTGRFLPGNPGGPGRKPGQLNPDGAAVRDMVLKALEMAGGASYLLERALDPDTSGAFLALVGRCLPRDIKLDAATGGSLEALILASLGARAAIAAPPLPTALTAAPAPAALPEQAQGEQGEQPQQGEQQA